MKSVLNSFSFIFMFSLIIIIIFVSWSTLLSSSHGVVAFSLNTEGEALLSLLNNFSPASSVPDSIKLSWNFSTSTTPCEWFGITCNTQNTHVVSLNLNYSGIYGQLGPQIGRLSYLQSLNLMGNHFSGPIPIELWNCSHLQHLDLSHNDVQSGFGFSGQLGPQIGQLRYLKYLDLGNNNFTGSIPIELWNCSHLQHLDLSFNTQQYGRLDLQSGFSGQLGPQIGQLRYLKSLDLSGNYFSGPIPIELWNCSHLQHLDLSYNIDGFSGQLGLQIGQLRYLKYLDLSFNHFSGSIPIELWNFSHLQDLILSSNNFTGELPKSLFQISGLESVDLCSNNFTGSIPKELGNCSRLQHLDLSSNHFTGELPETVRNLHLLLDFRISDNQLNGRIPESLFEIPGLERVDVSETNLSGSIPVNIGNATNLMELSLSGNRLHGNIPTSLSNCTGLSSLDLSNNGLSGGIPLGVWRIPTLEYFLMNDNNLSGEVPVEMTELRHLRYIYLNNNHFSGFIPKAFGINCSNLFEVDFRNNTFSGEIPPNLCFGKQLERMNLGLNQFHGRLDSILPSYTGNCYSLIELDLRGNNIYGKIPRSICSLVSSLSSLDFSENNMNGSLPQCLGDFNQLRTLNLRNNDFSGTLPPNFTSDYLQMLDLNGNRFEGIIPRIHSPRLAYLDLGNNQFNDTFPFFLGENISSLEILVLRSNKLYGPLKPPLLLRTTSYLNFFTQLKVLDISSNYFTGDLPLEFIFGLEAMKRINNVETIDNQDSIYYLRISSVVRYVGMERRRYYPRISSVVIYKGMETRLNRTFMDGFRAIDMSNNKLQGTIPESIGELVWLKMLNLSGNNLTAHIPSSIGNLKQLESLDLSQNKLSGEIPRHLTDIQFLCVFNVSHNNLTGRIPDGTQFQTFSNDSFSGNPGLCGFPLTTKCGDDANNESHQLPFVKKESDWNFGWEPVAIGYGCGVLIGLVIQYFVFTKASMYRWFG